jgi:segregation and condensation protein A
MIIEVKTGVFEGPLELLLDLIEKNKLSVNEISLAGITNEYVMRVKTIENFQKEEITSFLVVAATLMLIKSRSLLPRIELSENEEEDIQELQQRLALYKRIRELSRYIKALATQSYYMYSREATLDLPQLFYPPETLSPADLARTMRKLIEALPSHRREHIPEEVVQKIISLEEKISDLEKRIRSKIQESFSSYVGGAKEKVEIIVSFLAVLELVKQGLLMVEQESAFGDIHLKKSVAEIAATKHIL